MFMRTGSVKHVRVVGTSSGSWGKFIDIASVAWVRFEVTGTEFWVRFEVTNSGSWVKLVSITSGAWVRFVGTGIEGWVWSEGTGIGTRLGFGSGVGRPAEPVNRPKVLPTSGDGSEVGLLGTLAVSKVLVRSRVWVTVGLSELLAVGVEGPDIEVIFGAGIVLGPSARPSMVIIWTEGNVVSTTLGLWTVVGLQVLTFRVQGARSSCCFMGDVVTRGRATSEAGEGRG